MSKGHLTHPRKLLSYVRDLSILKNYLYNWAIGRSQQDLRNDPVWFLRQSPWIWPQYRIEGCRTYNHRHLLEMKIPRRWELTMQDHYDDILGAIRESLADDDPVSILRLGDGEAFFLRGEFQGNVVNRHVTDGSAEEKDLKTWREAYHNNDVKTFDTNWSLRRHWVPIEGDGIRTGYMPLSPVYALVATRDIFDLGAGYSLGLVGPGSKLDVVRELLSYPAYRGYLGIEEFDEYLQVPETGAANDADSLYDDLLDQSDGECDLYLVGMGIAKLRLLAPLRDGLDATIVDVGSGLDAIAGVVPKDRPYFGWWRNYRLRDHEYDDVDVMSQYMPDEKLAQFETMDDVLLR